MRSKKTLLTTSRSNHTPPKLLVVADRFEKHTCLSPIFLGKDKRHIIHRSLKLLLHTFELEGFYCLPGSVYFEISDRPQVILACRKHAPPAPTILPLGLSLFSVASPLSDLRKDPAVVQVQLSLGLLTGCLT